MSTWWRRKDHFFLINCPSRLLSPGRSPGLSWSLIRQKDQNIVTESTAKYQTTVWTNGTRNHDLENIHNLVNVGWEYTWAHIYTQNFNAQCMFVYRSTIVLVQVHRKWLHTYVCTCMLHAHVRNMYRSMYQCSISTHVHQTRIVLSCYNIVLTSLVWLTCCVEHLL